MKTYGLVHIRDLHCTSIGTSSKLAISVVTYNFIHYLLPCMSNLNSVKALC